MVAVRLTVFFDGLLNYVCWYTNSEFEHVLIGMSISFSIVVSVVVVIW